MIAKIYAYDQNYRWEYKQISMGDEMPNWTENEDVFMKRVFTCKHCNSMFAPMVGKPLNFGYVFILKSLKAIKYSNLINLYSDYGTMVGRLAY